jgi:hypothetical protein
VLAEPGCDFSKAIVALSKTLFPQAQKAKKQSTGNRRLSLARN